MTKPVLWITQDGRKIPVLWMTSKHLVYAFNMMLRKYGIERSTVRSHVRGNGHVFDAMHDELQARGLMKWNGSNDQLCTSSVRETPAQLCMLRALIDVKPKNCEEIIGHFYNAPDRMVEHINSHADPKWMPVRAKFAEYRLAGLGG